jgi:hypothetical protein
MASKASGWTSVTQHDASPLEAVQYLPDPRLTDAQPFTEVLNCDAVAGAHNGERAALGGTEAGGIGVCHGEQRVG